MRAGQVGGAGQGSGWPGCRGRGGGRGGDGRGCQPTPVPTEAGPRAAGPLCIADNVLPPRPPLVADPLTPIPSGCLLMANSSSRPESALQVPCSTLEPPSAPATHVQAGVCRAVAQTIRVGLFLLTGGYARGAPFVSCPSPLCLLSQSGRASSDACLSSALPHCSSYPVSSPLSPFFHPPRL